MQLDITERRPFTDGYQMLIGRAAYAVDPNAPRQRCIPDIDLVPRGKDGLVTFAGDVRILLPDAARSNHRLFFDWGNRGNLRALPYFNDARYSNDPRTADDAGNGFLMRRGYAVVWGAWQGDLLPGDGRMLLDLPVATTADSAPITGPVRLEYVGGRDVTTMPLSGWVSTRSHPAVSLDTTRCALTRRRYADAPRIAIPPDQWMFARRERGVGLDNQGADSALVASAEHIHIPAGFEPSWIYELVYDGTAPLALGLGHAAVRDLVSFLRYDQSPANPLAASVDHAYGWGRSQTGRAIRDYIYNGFNEDTQGRRVFDGLMPHVSGAGRLNTARFANLTVPAGQQYEDHFNPADRFPFAYAPTTDHLTGATDAILKRPQTDPRIIHTQTGTEYWQRRGSLVHTDTQGNDLPVPESVRIYLWSSSQHAADPNMGAPARGICQNLGNVVATSALFRAALDAMDRWVSEEVPPPPSRIPTRADGTLVTMARWRDQFPRIPGSSIPLEPSRFPLLDYGPDAAAGILSKEPPALVPGAEYTVLVPAVDADGNDIAGVRAPMVAAPLATYTGWNLRARGFGTGAMHEFSGSTIPFADSAEERHITGDPRPSIAERYADRAAYVAAIGAASRRLAADGFLLEEDVARAEAAAADWGRPRHDVRLP